MRLNCASRSLDGRERAHVQVPDPNTARSRRFGQILPAWTERKQVNEASAAPRDREKEAKQGSDPEATAKAEQELKELREHGKAAFNEMRRAWCEEGGGKDKSDEESQVCARWRVEGVKAEL